MSVFCILNFTVAVNKKKDENSPSNFLRDAALWRREKLICELSARVVSRVRQRRSLTC